MELMVKDLMQDLEKGNRIEKHLKDIFMDKKNTNQLNVPFANIPFMGNGISFYGNATTMQQQLGSAIRISTSNNTGGI